MLSTTFFSSGIGEAKDDAPMIMGIIKCLEVFKFVLEFRNMDRKKLILGLIGALFLLSGIYYRNISHLYIGTGTLAAGLIFYLVFPEYRELALIILGLIILHSGVILLLIKDYSHPELLGFMVFTAGVLIVLSSGFSDYLKLRKSGK